MQDTRVFLSFWVVNSLLFYLSPLVFGKLVVAGNARLTANLASLISGLIVTLADTLTMPVFKYFKIKLKDEWQWALAFLFVNVVTVWLIARYADLTGVGVSGAWVAVFLGTPLNLAQWLVWKFSRVFSKPEISDKPKPVTKSRK